MPNQGNKSKGRSGIEQKKRKPTMPATESHDKDGNAAKKSSRSSAKKGAGNATTGESNTASGDGGND